MPRTQLMSASRVRRTLTRLAYEIVERNRGLDNLVVCGIQERGLVLARQIVAELSAIESYAHTVIPIDIRAQHPLQTESTQIGGRDVVIVDDVLFSGKTAWTAVEAVLHAAKPESSQLAVLIDRGHRRFPIQPDFVGKTIPTKYGEQVVVETEGEVAVFLEE
ncbi:MAG: bifunctional pyr operon transcriptional regulator/uracil phosphoribosyltransferase PyrR [Rubricoccaceae bacterium]|nr:bifunctional pyr operon transcriptional regulator/uracil phosphoribosyltransferase PyrR [Rubricoccaceae bacterium]